MFIDGVEAANVLLAGSYSSVLLTGLPTLSWPPAISTLPLGSRVDVAKARTTFITGVEGANVSLAGSYNSVLLSEPPFKPPAISTLPLGSSVAVAP